MTLEETLVNVDLDVRKAIQNIPKDDNHCAIYIRLYAGEENVEESLEGCLGIEGSDAMIVGAFASMMAARKNFIKLIRHAIDLAEGKDPELVAEEMI